MKHFIFLLLATLNIASNMVAQNVGIGTTAPDPSALLDINSTTKGALIPRMGLEQRNNIINPAKGLIVYDTTHSAFFYYDGAVWRPSYEKNYDAATKDYLNEPGTVTNMLTCTLCSISLTNDNGIIYDNGGPTGNYLNNSNSSIRIISDDSTLLIKIVVEQMNVELNYDTLFIFKDYSIPVDTFVGTQTGSISIACDFEVRIYFKSNNIVNLSGFKINWGRVRHSAALQQDPPLYGWHFDNKKMAAMGGLPKYNNWHTDSIGFGSLSYGIGNKAKGGGSVSMGYNTKAIGDISTSMGGYTTASGSSSTAMGYNTTASGSTSTAMGYNTNAIGESSTAIGRNTAASGYSSTAIGVETTASGNYSTTLGYQTQASGLISTAIGTSTVASGIASFASGNTTTASGNYSVSMGSEVSTNGKTGTFFFGDSDPNNEGVRLSGTPNEFVCRFNGGYYIISSDGGVGVADIGVRVPSGGNAWVAISDRYRKENFQNTDGEVVLKKLQAISLGSWNYIGQDPKQQRHYGIMAQDFHEAFGQDAYGIIGEDTSVNPIDMQGIAFSAIQALELRTQKIKVLENEVIELKKKYESLEKAESELWSLILEMKNDILALKNKK